MTLLFKTEWDNLNVSIPHNFIDTNGVSIENGMLKLEGNLGTQNPARRPRIYLKEPLPLEYYMKAVFMIPPSNPVQKWLTFFEPLSEGGWTFQLVMDGEKNTVEAQFVNTDILGLTFPEEYIDMDVFSWEYGVPFEVIFHIKRDMVNGIIQVWKDNVLIHEFYGKTLFDSSVANTPIIADCYMSADEPTKIVYQGSFVLGTEVNDVFEETGPIIEPPPPESFTMEVKPCIVTAAGAPLALLTGLRAFRAYLPGWFVRGYYDFSKFVLAGW